MIFTLKRQLMNTHYNSDYMLAEPKHLDILSGREKLKPFVTFSWKGRNFKDNL